MKFLNVVLIIFEMSLLWYAVEGQNYFVSSTYTASLAQAEQQIVTMLQDYIESVEARMTILKQVVGKYANEMKELQESGLSTEHSPLHGYLLVKRTTADLDYILHLLIDPDFEDVYKNLTDMQLDENLPGFEDLDGAAAALIRLQVTYGLNTSSMAQGVLKSKMTSVPTIDTSARLSSRDCFFLGQHSLNENLLEQSIDWFQTAMVKADEDWYPNSSNIEILPHLEAAVKQLENLENEPARLNQMVLDDETAKPQLFDEILPMEVEQRQYRSLCRGERLRAHSMDKNLSCRYFYGHDAYFLLNPIRQEIRSLDPYIVVLHDVISDREIKILKEVSTPKLMRSSHYGFNGSFERSLLRTSANAWLTDDDHPEIKHINRRLSMITGLNVDHSMNDAEFYQVVNYGIGGHYVPHHDFLQMKTPSGHIPLNENNEFENKSGDRIATFMFYLTDVEAGGATVFPIIGVSIFPQKGSAAFWWNLKRNGEGDHLTRHGACPVLYGNKWVANKWFRSNSQMFRQPCSTDFAAKINDL